MQVQIATPFINFESVTCQASDKGRILSSKITFLMNHKETSDQESHKTSKTLNPSQCNIWWKIKRLQTLMLLHAVSNSIYQLYTCLLQCNSIVKICHFTCYLSQSNSKCQILDTSPTTTKKGRGGGGYIINLKKKNSIWWNSKKSRLSGEGKFTNKKSKYKMI